MKNKLFGEAPLLRLAVSMMAGIVIGNHVEAGIRLLPVLAGTVALALLLWKEALLQSVAIAVCFVLLGWLLMERQRASLRVQWPESEVRYEAVVLSEPQEKPKTMAVDIMLTGTTEETPVTASDYILGKNDEGKVGFFKAENGQLPAGKAYLKGLQTAGARLAISLVFDESTGIDAIGNSQSADEKWYTLDGRRLEGRPTKKGLYIRNGKKAIVK